MTTRHELVAASGGVKREQIPNYGTFSFGEIVEQVSVVNTNTEVNLTQKVPANAVVLYCNLNFDTAVGLATAVKVGVGVAANPDAYALSGTTMTKNTRTVNAPNALTTAETTVQVACVDTNGADAGTFNASATFSVHLVYMAVQDFSDAA